MPIKSLEIGTWNINGLFSRTIGVKFLDKDFIKSTEEVDLLCITETHAHKDTIDQLSIPGFKLLGFKNHKKNLKSNTARGGIAIFVKPNIEQLFTVLKSDSLETIWIKLKI